ncbi:MAG: hypothetical protein ACYTG1_01815 [Planctomycetota bacterium]|jgi:hypothetical protein
MDEATQATETTDRWKSQRDMLATLRRRTVFVGQMIARPMVGLRSCRYLIVFSHMRSRSTLLTHLLGSHPDISGYVETHLRYRRPRDFLKLRYQVSKAVGGATVSRYVMDKVLHNWYIETDLIERMHVRPIFLVRDPDEALPSIRRIMRNKPEDEAVRRSVRHYVKRLRWMKRCARDLTRPGIFLRSSDLIDRTEGVFRLLERELELSCPLSEEYEIFDRTGRPRAGDPSATIRTGRIVRDGEAAPDDLAPYPPELLDEARTVHERCVRALRRHCVHVEVAARQPVAAGSES